MNPRQQPRQDQQTRIAAIKSKIKEKQATNPSMSFQSAWNELQREQPHLFEEPDEHKESDEPEHLPPNVTWSEAIRLFKQMSPGQLVQAHLNGMLPDGTPWSESVTRTIMSARNSTPAEPRRNPFGAPLPEGPKPQTPLSKRINELMGLNEGLDLKTALEYLRNQEPELFPLDQQPEDIRHQAKVRDQVRKLHDAIDLHRKKFRHHDFAMAYQEVTQAHPELVRGLTRTLEGTDA